MHDDEVKRLLDALEEACHRSRRSRRDLERSLGVSNGYLSHLFSGRLDLKVRHIFQITAELGLDGGKFLRETFPDASRTEPPAPAAPAQAAPAPPRPAPASHDLVRDLIRDLVHQELTALLADRQTGSGPARAD